MTNFLKIMEQSFSFLTTRGLGEMTRVSSSLTRCPGLDQKNHLVFEGLN